MHVKVRFAPSPTGTLHIGSARTALFNWLFARRENGSFILRIEDTDEARSRPQLSEGILEDLKWLGLDWDEGPYRQSERMDVYRRYAERLFTEGRAYREKDPARGEAMKFKVPEESVKIKDAIHGQVLFDNALLEDFVLIKSDGSPSYNFACVVDDHEMGITHCIRGDDHLPNTPKQVALYRALGWEPPEFVHIPLILSEKESGGRLSKRKGAEGIARYRELGFIPDGLLNAMALLGFSPGENKEVVSREELMRNFSLKRINKKGSRFNFDKMVWVNAQHVKKMSFEEVFRGALPFIERAYGAKAVENRGYAERVVRLFQGRIKTFDEMARFSDFCFGEDPLVVPEAARLLAEPENKKRLAEAAVSLESLAFFDEVHVEKAIRDLAGRLGLKAKDLIHPLRAAVTGKTVSPGLFEVMVLLGRERVLRRLRKAQTSL